MHNSDRISYQLILKIFFKEINLISRLSGILDSDLSVVTFQIMIFPDNDRRQEQNYNLYLVQYNTAGLLSCFIQTQLVPSCILTNEN